METEQHANVSATALSSSSTEENEEKIRRARDAMSTEENGTKALEILNIISYFASENIHTEMFITYVGNKEEIGATIKLLKKYSLVSSDQDENILNIKSSVQSIIKRSLIEEEKEALVLKEALEILYGNKISSTNLNHAISVWAYESEHREPMKQLFWLPSHIVNELRAQVRYSEATTFGRKALDILRRTLGKVHPETLTLEYNIGTLLGLEGKYEESLKLLLPLFVKDLVFSKESEITDTLVIIARQLLELSRYREVLPIYEALFNGRQIAVTGDKTKLAAWHDYAILLSELGKHRQALEILRKIATMRSELFGPNHEDTLLANNSIAQVFIKQSNYKEALELFRKVYDKRRIVLGEDHIDTLRTKNNIALALQFQGKHDEAFPIYEVTAGKYEQVLGTKHPDTLVTRANLAAILHFRNEHEKALEIYKDIYEKQCEVLGPKQIETLRVQQNIASILVLQKKNDEALRILQQAYEGYNETCGPRHPDTVGIKSTIALLRMINFIT